MACPRWPLADRPHGEGFRHCAGAVFLLHDDRYGDVDEAHGQV